MSKEYAQQNVFEINELPFKAIESIVFKDEFYVFNELSGFVKCSLSEGFNCTLMNSKTDNYVHFVDEFNDNLIIDGTRILKGGAIEYFDIIDPKQSKLFPRKTSVDSFVYDRLFIRPNFPTRVYPYDQGFVFYLFHPRLVIFNSINKTFQVVPGRFRSHLKSKSHNNGLILSLENSLYFLDSTEKNAEVKLKKEFDQKITHLESNGLFDLLITEDNYVHKIFDFESVKSIKIEGSNIIDVFTEKSNVYILTDNMIQLIDSTFEKAEIIFHLGELAFEEFKSVKYYDDQLLLCSNNQILRIPSPEISNESSLYV